MWGSSCGRERPFRRWNRLVCGFLRAQLRNELHGPICIEIAVIVDVKGPPVLQLFVAVAPQILAGRVVVFDCKREVMQTLAASREMLSVHARPGQRLNELESHITDAGQSGAE